jgi:hypothetical protein
MDLFESAATETPWEWAQARRRWFTSPLKDAVAGVVTAIVTGVVSYFAGDKNSLQASVIAVSAGLVAGVLPPQLETLYWRVKRDSILLEEENKRLREERQRPDEPNEQASRKSGETEKEKRRALITSWRIMVAKAHQHLAESRMNLPVIRILEQYEEFHALRPYLSANTKKSLYHAYGIGVGLEMALTGTHPDLRKVSDDIDRIEAEWGVRL